VIALFIIMDSPVIAGIVFVNPVPGREVRRPRLRNVKLCLQVFRIFQDAVLKPGDPFFIGKEPVGNNFLDQKFNEIYYDNNYR
jgi:hypothetical protein